MNDDEKINKLAQDLYSKGFAGSLWDAKNKAKDILGLNNQLKSYRSYEERKVNDIMSGAGINVEAVKKAEEQKIQQIIENVQEHFHKEAVERADAESMAQIEQMKSTCSIVEDIPKEKTEEKPAIKPAYFSDSVEGATADMTVNELMGIKEEKQSEPAVTQPEEKNEGFIEINMNEPPKEETSNESDAVAETGKVSDEEVKLETYEESSQSVEEPEKLEIKEESEQSGVEEDEFVAVSNEEAKPEEEMPKLIDEEFSEEEKEEKTVIDDNIGDNVFSDVDNDKIEEENEGEKK